MNLKTALEKAENSSFELWKLNLVLWKVIPFNAPHKPKLVEVKKNSLKVELPFIRKNQNHIKGMHACALATLSEYVCGLLLMKILGTDQYRIILKSLRLDYHAQGKKKVFACFEIDPEWLEKTMQASIKTDSAWVHTFQVDVLDEDQRLISSAYPEWQIKPWALVKTKV